jgi:hypothetical protein
MSTVQVQKRDLERLDQYTRNMQWLLENMSDLRRRYPDRYVAVCDAGERILDAATMDELMDKLTRSGLEPTVCATDFVSREEYVLIV